MKIKRITLAANQPYQVNIAGLFIRCDSASGPFFVDRDNRGEAVRLNTGKSIEGVERFQLLTVTSETAQTVELEIGDERISANEISGAVQVSNTIGQIAGSKTQSAAMKMYAGGVEYGGAGPASGLAFQNATADDLYLTKLVVRAGAGAGTPVLEIDYVPNYVVNPLFQSANVSVLRDLSDADLANAIGTLGAAPNGNAMQLMIRAHVADDGPQEFFSESAPLKLVPNSGIVVVNGDSTELSMYIEAQTTVPQSFSGAAAQNAPSYNYLVTGSAPTRMQGEFLAGLDLATMQTDLAILVTATTAQLNDVTHSINTHKKYLGKTVYATDTQRVYTATGASPGHQWVNE